jgi:hypothetical protein
MKLASAMVDRALDQFDAEALPDNHPAVSQLNEMFGDHTFFLDVSGLHILEPTAHSEAGAQTWQVVKRASWKDATPSSLMPRNPEPTNIVVTLPHNGPDGADRYHSQRILPHRTDCGDDAPAQSPRVV